MNKINRLCYHVDHVSCYTYFSITGDFEIKSIIEKLGLSPYEYWEKGDIRKNGKDSYNFSCLKFGLCKDYDVIVSNQMSKTIAPFMDKIEILKEIKKENNVNFTLAIVPMVRFDESSPCLAPSKEVMKFCVETDTEIDIDLYVGCPDSYDDAISLIRK